jgi:hypothetical protein
MILLWSLHLYLCFVAAFDTSHDDDLITYVTVSLPTLFVCESTNGKGCSCLSIGF